MSITNLGKRRHKVLRHVEFLGTGQWIDGEWIPSVTEEITIYANIQPSTLSYRTQMLPSGDREKEAIAIFSNDWLHIARTGSKPIKADTILYRGAHWEVVVSKPYQNFGEHCEALAIKVDDTIVERDNGNMRASKYAD